MIPDKYLQVVAHFYRGEMNRLTIYRSRLDNTFQYSIVLTSALLVYNLQHSWLQYFPFLIIFLNLFFCFIESRRYRYFLIIQNRVSIMEKDFYANKFLGLMMKIKWIGNYYLLMIFRMLNLAKVLCIV
jgi:uncharacterized membrane protein